MLPSLIPANRPAAAIKQGPPTAIVVAGMHRSGTSAVARALSLLGADLPSDLLGPAADNELGFWESTTLIKLHDKLLGAFDQTWSSLLPLPKDWQQTPAAAEYRADLAAYVAREFPASPLFVLKDPRVCRVLPALVGALESLGIAAVIALPYRNPAEVTASLFFRNRLPAERGMLLWLRHVIDAERMSRGYPRSFISYTGLIADWRSTLKKLRGDLGLRGRLSLRQHRSVLAAFLSASERHHDLPKQLARVHPWVAGAYQAMRRLDRDPGDQRCRAGLDRIAARLDRERDPLFRFTADQTRWGEILANQLGNNRRQQAEAAIRLSLAAAEEEEHREDELARVAERPQLAAAAPPPRLPLQLPPITIDHGTAGDACEIAATPGRSLLARAAERPSPWRRATGNGSDGPLLLAAQAPDAQALADAVAGRLRQLGEVRGLLQRQQAELAARDAELAAARAEFEAAQARLRGQAEKIQQADMAAAQAAAGLSALREEAEALRQGLAASEAARAELSGRVEAADAAVAERDVQLADLRRETGEREAMLAWALQQAEAGAGALAERNAEIADLRRVIADLRRVIAEREAVLDEREAVLDEQRQLAERLGGDLCERDTEIAEMRRQITEREAEIDQLHQAAEAARAELAERGAAVAELRQQSDERQASLDRLLADAERRLREAGAQIDGLTARLDEADAQLSEKAGEREAARAAADAARQARERATAERDQLRRLWRGRRSETADSIEQLAVLDDRSDRVRRRSILAWSLSLPDLPPGEAETELMALVAESGLFDASWYARAFAELGLEAPTYPIEHFVRFGIWLGLDPSPLFDTGFYVRGNPDLDFAAIAPFKHFLRRGSEARDPNPVFDARRYLAADPGLAATGANPLVHYLRHGAAEGRSPSTWLDIAWFVGRQPEVAGTGNLLVYFLTEGVRRRLSPNPLFDIGYYFERYPDARASGLHPIEHYALIGAGRGYKPSPYFDTAFYIGAYPDVAAAGLNPLVHYLEHGWREGRQPNPLFDPAWYRQAHPDIGAAGLDPLTHFLEHGAAERRQTHPDFDPQFYLDRYKELAAADCEPLRHFLDDGVFEGRQPNAWFDPAAFSRTRAELADPDAPPFLVFLKGCQTSRTPGANDQHMASDGQARPPHSVAGSGDIQTDPQEIEVSRLRESGLFDENYYRKEYPDLQEGIDLVEHFIKWGGREGRNPHPLFITTYYLTANKGVAVEVAAARTDPLTHFLVQGGFEGHNPHPLFHTSFYLRRYPDVAASGQNPLVHYLRHGVREHRICNAVGHSPFDNYGLLPGEAPELAGVLERFQSNPLISVVMSLYATKPIDAGVLVAAIRSIQRQTYSNWELCICDNGSTDPAAIRALQELGEGNARIRMTRIEDNQGISAGTNAALQLAAGEFVALMDHDDLLSANALYEMVKYINRDHTTDVLYSDQDKIDLDDNRSEPFYKPDWSPEYFRGVMYVGHLLVIRRSLLDRVGGLDSNFDKVQDFELMLRLSEATDSIVHIAKILYHWRMLPGSTALGTDEKSGIPELQMRAVAAHLARLGVKAKAVTHAALPHRVKVLPDGLRRRPLVSIVIPSRDSPDYIGPCLDSIFGRTSYDNYEVIVVDNDTRDQRALEILRSHPIRHCLFNEPFNYSRANNLGVRQSSGEYVIFLNNDTLILHENWIENLLFYFLEYQDVGIVGPLLTYATGMVQHGGVALVPGRAADHLMRLFDATVDGYGGSLCCAREVSAVTAACLMMPRRLFDEIGGFAEEYATHYQDLDLCLKVRNLGLRILYTPHSQLHHHESVSRGEYYDHLDGAVIRDVWGEVIDGGDPYYNVNFDSRYFDYTVSRYVARPWRQ